MPIRIAFCGPNIELCENLTRHTRDLIYNEVVDIAEPPNPIKELIEQTRRLPDEDDNDPISKFQGADLDWLSLWSCSIRRIMLDAARDSAAIISASCGIDQVAIQATWLHEQMTAAATGLSMVDSQGNPIPSAEQLAVNRSGAVLQVVLNSAEEELVEIWDFVYAVLPVGVSASYPDLMLAQYADFIETVPAFSEVQRLPDNETSALDALSSEVSKWKTKLGLSS